MSTEDKEKKKKKEQLLYEKWLLAYLQKLAEEAVKQAIDSVIDGLK